MMYKNHCQTIKLDKACYAMCNAEEVERAQVTVVKESSRSIPPVQSPMKTRLRSSYNSSTTIKDANNPPCRFCGKSDGNMHNAESFKTFDAKVREMATELRDTQLIAKLAAGSDVVAIDWYYHKDCYTALCNRHRSLKHRRSTGQGVSESQMTVASLAFAEIVAYLEEHRQQSIQPNMSLSYVI